MRSTALLLLLAAAAGSGLARGSPASCTLHTPLSAGLLRFEASDGQELLSATWAPRRTGLSCRVSVEPREVASFLSRCRLAQRLPGGPPLPDLVEAKASCESVEPGGGGSPLRRAKRGFTYPGTLWCGAGNIAESYDQLGKGRSTGRNALPSITEGKKPRVRATELARLAVPLRALFFALPPQSLEFKI